MKHVTSQHIEVDNLCKVEILDETFMSDQPSTPYRVICHMSCHKRNIDMKV